MAITSGINYTKGNLLDLKLTARDELGNVLNLSGYNLRGSVKYRYSSSSKLLDLSPAFITDTGGYFLIYCSPQSGKTLPVVEALYDIEAYTSQDFIVKTLYKGKFNIYPEVTTDQSSLTPPPFFITPEPITPPQSFKIYYGGVSGPGLQENVPLITSSQITGLQASVNTVTLVGDFNGIFNFNAVANSYKYICVPTGLPEISNAIDYESASPPPLNSVPLYTYPQTSLDYYLTGVMVNNEIVTYRVYRTVSRSSIPIKIQIS